ncbi:hypothetical protein DQK91_22340 [Oceanidesulfovibrio marinus]|uniref:Uncharacterized protein n=1 Tax=Oceanidesulfovibrio marinus TaxID=370038 RepID=A0A6P1ZAR6_9BACT|nr:hypothetical protein DQK91_22340 [Oceanidesulfovibrio marinus]
MMPHLQSVPAPNKRYVAMVGLPVMGKSVIAYKMQHNLSTLGLSSLLFNNG